MLYKNAIPCSQKYLRIVEKPKESMVTRTTAASAERETEHAWYDDSAVTHG